MNSPEPPDPLSRTLAEWQVRPRADPDFRPAVWQRIQQRGRETWDTYVQARLAAWTVVALVTVGAAGWAGVSAGKARLSAEREAMVVSYLVELDPRVQARLRP
jgi:hypothetical protein